MDTDERVTPQISNLYRTFSNPRRVQIIDCLVEYDRPVSFMEIVRYLNQSNNCKEMSEAQTKVYHHDLPSLEQFDIVIFRKDNGLIFPGHTFDSAINIRKQWAEYWGSLENFLPIYSGIYEHPER